MHKVSIMNDNGGDWMVVYVDGKKVFEHHPSDLEVDWLLEQLGIDVEYLTGPPLSWYHYQGENGRWYSRRLPDTVEEFKETFQ